MTGRLGRRSKKLFDDLKQIRGYWKLIEGALRSHSVENWLGRECGPVVRQNTE